MNREEHEQWFATLKPGDIVAARRWSGSHGPWHRRVVQRTTGATLWLEPAYSRGAVDKVTPRSRSIELRAWTAEDQQRHEDAEADARIRRWVDQHVPTTWGGKPLDPKVRAAMLRAMAEVDRG